MNTKYGGQIKGEPFDDYLNKLIKRIYKILPMKQEESKTLNKYINFLMIELSGGDKLLIEHRIFIELLFNMESLNQIEDIDLFKSQVFKCINICKKILTDYKDGKLV